MKCLFLLLFFLPWEVHSFKQLKLDYNRCKVDYFCMLTADLAMQSKLNDYLVKANDLKPETTFDIGILIKPLRLNKWLLVLYAEKMVSTEKGIVFYIKRPGETNLGAQWDGFIAGCNVDGTIKGTDKAPDVTFDMRLGDSIFEEDKKIVCVGILSTKDRTKEIANVMNDLQTGSRTFMMAYVENVHDGFGDSSPLPKRLALINSAGAKGAVDFTAANALIRCDFDLLKPPLGSDLLMTHMYIQVESFIDSIDCKNNLFEPSRTTLDLLIKPKNANQFLIAEKITCDNKILSYKTTDGTVENISNDAVFACGERPRCTLPNPAGECGSYNCSDPIPSDCNTGGDGRCEKIKCPGNQWFFDGSEHIGAVECRRESVEDFSGFNWFTKIDDNRVLMDNGSCIKISDCQTKHPLKWTCGNLTEGCTWPTFVPSRVYCPWNHVLKFKEEVDGNQFDIDSLECDLETGEWKVNATELGQVKIVYCIDKELNNNNTKLDGESQKSVEEDFYEFWIYVGLVITTIIAASLITFCVVKCLANKRQKKRNAYYERIKDVKKWTRAERYNLRPQNRHNFIDEFMLGYDNLAVRDSIVLCEGLWLDFNLYSVRERVTYLGNIFKEFGRDANIIRMATPLLRRCTERDIKLVNDRQPLHPATVKLAMCILKVLCLCYGKRGIEDSEQRIRKIIGIRAYNIFFTLQLHRPIDEDPDTTLIRISIIEALIFAGDNRIKERLLKVWYEKGEKGQDMGTPVRKFVWGAAVKFLDKFDMIKAWLDVEIEKKKNGTQEKDDTRWGDKISHYIYALCASDRGNTEPFFNNVIKDPFFTNEQMLCGFQAMLEVWDDNHTVARFLFMERHHFIRKKIAPASPEYRELYKMIYTYVIYFPNNDEWMWKFITYIDNHGESNFTFEEKQKIDFATATIFGGLYGGIYKFDDIVEDLELELGEEENLKEDERGRTSTEEKSSKTESSGGMHSPRPKKKDNKDSKANPKKDSTRNCSKRKTKKLSVKSSGMPVDSLKDLKERTAMERETMEEKTAMEEKTVVEQTAMDGRSKKLNKSKKSKRSEKSKVERSTQADKTSTEEKRPVNKTEKRPVKKKGKDSVRSTQED